MKFGRYLTRLIRFKHHHFVGFKFESLKFGHECHKTIHERPTTMALHIFSLIPGKHTAPTMLASSVAIKGQVSDGQLHPNETPELIAQKLIEMESEIEKLQIAAADPNTKQNCLQLSIAQQRCPELMTDAFKLMFLRCEVFNANVSYVCCVSIVCLLYVRYGRPGFCPVSHSHRGVPDEII
jgi:hypothetical protein